MLYPSCTQNIHPHRARCNSRAHPEISGGGASFNYRFFSTEISGIVCMGSAALMWLSAARADHPGGFLQNQADVAGRAME